VFRYRLHSPDGDDLGEATYAMLLRPGEEIHVNGGQADARARSRALRRGGRVSVRGLTADRACF
jgi:hypothetical protein